MNSFYRFRLIKLIEYKFLSVYNFMLNYPIVIVLLVIWLCLFVLNYRAREA